MPTYEYECSKCGHVFEKYQTIMAKPVRTCPECKGKVKRLLGAGAAILVGGTAPSACAPGGCPVPRGGAPCCGANSPCIPR